VSTYFTVARLDTRNGENRAPISIPSPAMYVLAINSRSSEMMAFLYFAAIFPARNAPPAQARLVIFVEATFLTTHIEGAFLMICVLAIMLPPFLHVVATQPLKD
jgi:hypothetical protein